MVTNASSGMRGALEDQRIVDAGIRVQETIEEILPYVDSDTAAHEFLDLSNNPRGEVYGGISAYPLYEYKRSGDDDTPSEDGEMSEAIDFGAVARLCEEHGVDVGVVNPTLNRGLAEVNNDRFAVALASGYNDWLVDGLDDHERLVGNMLVAPQHPERAAEEIDRIASESDIVGLHLPITGLDHPAGHRSFTPIHEAAADHGLPITLQPTVGLSSFHQQFYESDYFAQDYVTHHPFLLLRNLTSIMFEGVPVRYPDLDFVVLDCGVGWAPYTIMRMDDHYLELGYEIPALDKLPSEYFTEGVYWGTAPIHDPDTHPDPEYLSRAVEMVGPSNVLFSSDIPHPTTDTPSRTYELLEPQLERNTLSSIFGDEAAGVFDL